MALKAGIDLAHDCFVEWDLCGDDVGAHIRKLREAGALAVKPTGSGGGGYVLSFWGDVVPPKELQDGLIAVSLSRSNQIEGFVDDMDRGRTR